MAHLIQDQGWGLTSGFRDQGSGFKICDLGLRVQGLGFGVESSVIQD